VRFIFDLSAIALPFFLLPLAQPHARPAAVLVDELDAGYLKNETKLASFCKTTPADCPSKLF
jgi:hypothetical protein